MELPITDANRKKSVYIRSFTFGVEDSLVSTVGLLSGIAAAGMSSKDILIAGIVLIFVEAFSMGVGELLSEHSSSEFEHGHEVAYSDTIKSGLLMFASYFVSGFIPLAPYIFFSLSIAFPLSIILSLLFLFILGAGSGKALKTGILRNGVRMFLLGGAAIALGVIVGQLVK
jgi:VIT1/CCC1 family predicted Fe2+/Mn2+ transporter